MTLREFIEKFVCKNTVIRLWRKEATCHRMIVEDATDPEAKEVGMEWIVTEALAHGNKVVINADW